MRLWLSLTLFIFSYLTLANPHLPYLDKDFGCSAPEKVEQYISDFSIDIKSFGGKELCDPNVDFKKLMNDIAIIEQGQFNPSAPTNAFIVNSIPSDRYYEWTRRMTYGIRRGHDIPNATAYNSGGYFTFQDGWAQLSTLGRVGTFIHEARHTPGYRHYPCDQGPYANVWMDGCDESLQQQGAHQVEMEYYSRVVLQGVNFHPVYKSMARLMNLARANFVFNKPALNHSDALLYITQNNSAHLVHQDFQKHYNYDSALPVLLKRASMGATLFSGDMSYSLDLNDPQTFLTGLPDVYSYFKVLYMENTISNFIDLEEIDVGIQRYLVALDGNGILYRWNFNNASWGKSIDTGNGQRILTMSPKGKHGIFIYTAANTLIPVDVKSFQLKKEATQNWPKDAAGFVKFQNNIIKLNKNGTLEDNLNVALPIRNNNYVQQVINVPVYDAYDYF